MPATIVGRCQRFDFRRLTMETLATQLQAITASEGGTITDSAALAIARQAEGSSRDALSLLDQASVMGGDVIDDDVVRSLLGAPRGEVQHELADAVAVGDARTAFEIVNRLVQDGQDLRNVTAEALGPLPQPAPGQDRARARRTSSTSRPTGTSSCASRARSSPPARSPASSPCCSPPRTTCAGPRRPASPWNWPWSAPRSPRPTRTPPASSPASNASNAWRTSMLPPAPVVRRAARRTRRLFRSSLLRSSGPQGRRLPTHRPPSVPEAAARRHVCGGRGARRGDPEERSREAASTGIVAPTATPTVAADCAPRACRRRCMRRMPGAWMWRCSGGGGRR